MDYTWSVYIDACGWLCGDVMKTKVQLIDTTNRWGLFLTEIKKFDTPIPEKRRNRHLVL